MKNLKFIFLFIFMFIFVSTCTPSYTVSLVSNNDQVLEAIPYEKGGELNLPSVTKEGYDFGGWYYESNFVTKYEKQEITKDITLYAKWDIKSYEVKFMDGSQELSKVKVDHGKNATAPANPSKEGYTFKGWDKTFTNVTKNLVVYAQFEMLTFEVKFMVDGVQLGETQEVDYGAAAVQPANPTKEGFTFTGWDKGFENVHEDLVINAVFEKKTFTVTFIGKDNSQLSTQTIEYGMSASAPATFTYDGYTFTKWDKDYSSVKENLTVKAVYTAIEYEIEYFDGTTKLTLTPAKYTIEDAIVYPVYEKTDRLFIGWYQKADFTDEAVTGFAKGKTGKVTLYAKTLDATQKSDIVYELNGGSWGWTVATVTDPAKGINAVSNLPEIFMQDFYTYLKDNNLLNSTVVDQTLRVNTWANFSKLTGDPLGHYNKTTTNTAATTNGYSQFFVDGGAGNATTGDITNLLGGFFGADGYKEKYATLAQHASYLLNDRYTATNTFWTNGASESLAGFIFDGYFYGTQGLLATSNAKHPRFNALRAVIPTPEKGYKYVNNALVEYTYDFLKDSMVNGTEAVLSIPSKEGFFFAGWYVNEDFSGDRVYKIPAGSTPATKYYAKWVAVS